jgi:hypothetical protein
MSHPVLLTACFTLFFFCSVYSWTLEMEETCSSETSVGSQRTTGCYIPEDGTLRNHRFENLKSYVLISFYDRLNHEYSNLNFILTQIVLSADAPQIQPPPNTHTHTHTHESLWNIKNERKFPRQWKSPSPAHHPLPPPDTAVRWYFESASARQWRVGVNTSHP